MEDYPVGYPKVSCYLDSDDCFMIYRRFGLLHARLLLTKQDELRELEEDLLEMDEADAAIERNRRFLHSRAKDFRRKARGDDETRRELLARIEKKTLEYGTLRPFSLALLRNTHPGRELITL